MFLFQSFFSYLKEIILSTSPLKMCNNTEKLSAKYLESLQKFTRNKFVDERFVA